MNDYKKNDITVDELRRIMGAQKMPRDIPAEISFEKLKEVFSDIVKDKKLFTAILSTGRNQEEE